jgi:hypothetical protein
MDCNDDKLKKGLTFLRQMRIYFSTPSGKGLAKVIINQNQLNHEHSWSNTPMSIDIIII